MELKISTNQADLKNELLEIPVLIYRTSNRILKFEEKYLDFKQTFEEFQGTLSNEISLNPEKYGFPYGEKVERFRLLGRIFADPQFKHLKRQMLKYQSLMKSSQVYKEALLLKFEAIKCLLINHTE